MTVDARGPYADDAEVGRLTRRIVEAGHPILQSHKLMPTDREHIARLLLYFDLPVNAHVLDVGCGVGRAAFLMQQKRPDLCFTLFNYSRAQLALAPDMCRVVGDMHDLPFPGCFFHAVMYLFSLGHGDLDRSLAEARRVLWPGGVLCIYDITADRPDDLVERMGYRPHRRDEVAAAAALHGMLGTWVMPDASTEDFKGLVGRVAFDAMGFDLCRPVIYRFTVAP